MNPKYSSLLLLAVLALASGCATTNTNPNILAEEPYNQVRYVTRPTSNMKVIKTVTVTRAGAQANVLNTIPSLYKQALEETGNAGTAASEPLFISNIRLTSFTKREPYRVPYQDCKNERKLKYVNKQECGNKYDYGKRKYQYKCETKSVQDWVDERVCRTNYKTEVRDVLYETATGDVLN